MVSTFPMQLSLLHTSVTVNNLKNHPLFLSRIFHQVHIMYLISISLTQSRKEPVIICGLLDKQT